MKILSKEEKKQLRQQLKQQIERIFIQHHNYAPTLLAEAIDKTARKLVKQYDKQLERLEVWRQQAIQQAEHSLYTRVKEAVYRQIADKQLELHIDIDIDPIIQQHLPHLHQRIEETLRHPSKYSLEDLQKLENDLKQELLALLQQLFAQTPAGQTHSPRQ